ncbi:hypothetical protein EVA_14952 [gut metagenome]|uniref:Uncharacterized protein n=1 Tax=gut metagenome TaxID=749906 RepID=J9CAI2_9ZZZZ
MVFPHIIIVVISSHVQYLVSDEVFSGTVRLNYSRHHILGYILIVRQKLLGILWQTVATISKAWVIVMCSYSWIETYALNDSP